MLRMSAEPVSSSNATKTPIQQEKSEATAVEKTIVDKNNSNSNNNYNTINGANGKSGDASRDIEQEPLLVGPEKDKNPSFFLFRNIWIHQVVAGFTLIVAFIALSLGLQVFCSLKQLQKELNGSPSVNVFEQLDGSTEEVSTGGDCQTVQVVVEVAGDQPDITEGALFAVLLMDNNPINDGSSDSCTPTDKSTTGFKAHCTRTEATCRDSATKVFTISENASNRRLQLKTTPCSYGFGSSAVAMSMTVICYRRF